MDILALMMVVVAAYCFGIHAANSSWINNVNKERSKECRGKLYKVLEQE